MCKENTAHLTGNDQRKQGRHMDKKIQLEIEIQAELERRTAVEKKAIQAISQSDFGKANELIASLDNRILKGLVDEFAKAGREAGR